MTDARRVGPVVILVVGAAMVVSAFFATPAPSTFSVGLVTTTTSVSTTTSTSTSSTTSAPSTTTTSPTTAPVSGSTGSSTGTTVEPETASPATTEREPAHTTPASHQLPVTGAPSLGLLVGGIVLLLIGTVLLLGSRWRRTSHETL